MFAHAIVRKVAALLVVAACAYFGTARASDNHPDQGYAYQHCMSYATAKAGESHPTWTFTNPRCENKTTYYECNVTAVRKSDGSVTWNKATCAPGEAGAVSSGIADAHGFSVLCTARADLGGLSVANFQNAGKVCSFGCEYGQTTPAVDTTITDKNNPSNSIRYGLLLGGKANGNTCTNPDGRDKPKDETDPPSCLAVGSDSAGTIYHCPKADGSSCTISGRGTKFCQPPPPNTEGPKVDSARQDGASQSTDGNAPPQPPAPRPGENWQQSSSSSVTNNITNATSNSSTYNNVGTPNANGTPVPGDGSGPGGTGQQSGSGSGSGSGTGTGEGTDMGPTNSLLTGIKDAITETFATDAQFEAEVAALLGKGEQAPEEVEPDDPLAGSKEVRGSGWFMDQLDNSGFLGGGSCPTLQSVSVGTATIAIELGPICQLLSAISGLVVAVAYLIAFRIMAG